MKTYRIHPALAGLAVAVALSTQPVAAQQPQPWTLEASVRQALAVAPEIREAQAEVAAREGALTQAGAWPNPSIDLRADRKLGLQDARGGNDLTQIAITQSLPITRLARQRAQAEAQRAAAGERLRLVRLTRETEAARAARPRHGPYRRVFLDRALHRRGDRAASAARNAGPAVLGRGVADGGRCVAAPHRAPCAPAPTRGARAPSHARARRASPTRARFRLGRARAAHP